MKVIPSDFQGGGQAARQAAALCRAVWEELQSRGTAASPAQNDANVCTEVPGAARAVGAGSLVGPFLSPRLPHAALKLRFGACIQAGAAPPQCSKERLK